MGNHGARAPHLRTSGGLPLGALKAEISRLQRADCHLQTTRPKGHAGSPIQHSQDYPEGRFTLAFVGYGKEEDEAVLELTHNWDTKHYELGTAYGHIALEVPDAAAACAQIKARGGKVVREAGPMKHGTTVIAFVEDPDGYKVELIERRR